MALPGHIQSESDKVEPTALIVVEKGYCRVELQSAAAPVKEGVAQIVLQQQTAKSCGRLSNAPSL